MLHSRRRALRVRGTGEARGTPIHVTEGIDVVQTGLKIAIDVEFVRPAVRFDSAVLQTEGIVGVPWRRWPQEHVGFPNTLPLLRYSTTPSIVTLDFCEGFVCDECDDALVTKR